ncbi:hypothetical protein HYZ98_04815 [Candidatus Peregrinibacteria bacterium]|nr:hypothetical protein [Candidatus Peregrinibacteria bacterium]
MRIFFGLCGIVLSFFMLKYRERVGDTMGEADWMRSVGGVYMIVIVLAVLIFLWSLAAITNTMDILLFPVFLIPGLSRPGPPPTPTF